MKLSKAGGGKSSTTELLIDTGASVTVLRDEELAKEGTLRSSKAQLTTADGTHNMEVQSQGGVSIGFGSNLRSVYNGVYFTEKAATNLISLTTLHEMGVSVFCHEGRVLLADSKTVSFEKLHEFQILVEEDYRNGLPYVTLPINPMEKTTIVATVRSKIVARASLIIANARKDRSDNKAEVTNSLPRDILQAGVHLAR